ncbi:MAG: triose-phosphate isomerase [Alphaproteobacteria bacterium]|nr:triose-phosphate isomerase [Alphaproteobacteria bacterium]
MPRRQLIAGNWKMNGLADSGRALAADLAARAASERLACSLLVCPPATLLGHVRTALEGSPVALGAQDCHAAASGAHTGDVSAEMLADVGCRYVIVGHSERRQNHGETDAVVRAKAEAVRRAGLIAIVCVGETLAERDAGRALDVVGRQLSGSLPEQAAGMVVAYEPVWAIGTGRTAGTAEIDEMHRHIRGRLAAQGRDGENTLILYGGSVKPDNAVAILGRPDVDGALVGGASLKAADFWAIAKASPRR